VVSITDTAAEKFREVLKAEGKEDWGIRIYVAGGGCCPSYGLDLCEKASENDEVVDDNGIRLIIDKQLAPSIAGMKIDYIDDGMQQGFALMGGNPSCGTDNGSSGGCGCTSC